eukprot:15458567-Alexandrium_andersonii.AAC.1
MESHAMGRMVLRPGWAMGSDTVGEEGVMVEPQQRRWPAPPPLLSPTQWRPTVAPYWERPTGAEGKRGGPQGDA